MQTIITDQLRGDILVDAMRKLHANPRSLPEGYYSASVEPGVAMLVEPVNDHPFVFVPPNVVHKFEGAPGSGTDHLRQRMLACIFFRNVVDTKKAQAQRAVQGAERVERVEASKRRSTP